MKDKKVIWITGASSGIGKALAIKFAENDWIVAVSARRENLLNELKELNKNIYSFPLDPVMHIVLPLHDSLNKSISVCMFFLFFIIFFKNCFSILTPGLTMSAYLYSTLSPLIALDTTTTSFDKILSLLCPIEITIPLLI